MLLLKPSFSTMQEPSCIAVASLVLKQPSATLSTTPRCALQLCHLQAHQSIKPSAARKIDDPFGTIVYSSELIFEKIPGAPAHHASSMTVAANGDLLVTWYGGSYESSDDESLYLARRRKGSRSWDKPIMLLRNPEQPVGNAVIFTVEKRRHLDHLGSNGSVAAHVGAHRMGRDSADVPSLKRRRQDMVR